MGNPKRKEEGEITQLLQRCRGGDSSAFDALVKTVYGQLRSIARRQMAQHGHMANTLSPTGLVHELILKLSNTRRIPAEDRSHFFAVAAKSMRWLLQDYARSKYRQKRGHGAVRVSFDERFHLEKSTTDILDPIDLEAALKKLEASEPRIARVVELRYLMGLTVEETSEVLGVAPRTIKRDWQFARAFLVSEINKLNQ